MNLSKPSGGKETLVERLRAIISDAQDALDFDASQAFDGDRPDLWDEEAEVPLSLLREAASRIEALEEERATTERALLKVDPDWYARGEEPCGYPRCGCEPDAICHIACNDALVAQRDSAVSQREGGDSSAISQSASALLGAPSGSEPAGPICPSCGRGG